MGITLDSRSTPEYQEFLTRFHQGPYQPTKSEGTSEEIDWEATIGQVDAEWLETNPHHMQRNLMNSANQNLVMT